MERSSGEEGSNPSVCVRVPLEFRDDCIAPSEKGSNPRFCRLKCICSNALALMKSKLVLIAVTIASYAC